MDWSQEVLVDFDVMDAALVEALPTTAGFSFERKALSTGSFEYVLSHIFEGEIGRIRLRKGPKSCWLDFTEPKKPNVQWSDEDKQRLRECATRQDRWALLCAIQKDHEAEAKRRHEALKNAFRYVLDRLEHRLSKVDMPFYADLAPSPTTGPGMKPDGGPALPKRGGYKRRWRQVWRLIRPEVAKAKTAAEIAAWLERTHPDLTANNPETVGRIIAAGEAGLLDHDL